MREAFNINQHTIQFATSLRGKLSNQEDRLFMLSKETDRCFRIFPRHNARLYERLLYETARLLYDRIQQASIGVSEGCGSRVTARQGRSIRDLRSTGDGSRLVPIRAIKAFVGYAARGESQARGAQDHLLRATPGIEEAGELRAAHYRQR